MPTVMIKGFPHTCNSPRARCFHCILCGCPCEIYLRGLNRDEEGREAYLSDEVRGVFG